MPEPVLDASSLQFSYPLQFSLPRLKVSFFAFRDLHVRIPRGSIYGLLGPNGCGKSTLLQLALGLLTVDEGRFRVLGMDPAAEAVEIRRRIGYVPQKPDLDPEMSVSETLDFVSMFFADRWNRGVAEQALDRFDLDRRIHDQVGSLSAGFRQRLSLVTALAIEPEVLVLDEPTAGLDAVIRRDFAAAVIDYMATGEQRTVIIASHLLSEIEALVDYVGILRSAGQGASNMLIEAPLDELKERALIVKARSLGRFEPLGHGVRVLAVTGENPVSAVYLLDHGDQRHEVADRLEAAGAEDLRIGESSLEEIFVVLSQQPVVFLPEVTNHPDFDPRKRLHA